MRNAAHCQIIRLQQKPQSQSLLHGKESWSDYGYEARVSVGKGEIGRGGRESIARRTSPGQASVLVGAYFTSGREAAALHTGTLNKVGNRFLRCRLLLESLQLAASRLPSWKDRPWSLSPCGCRLHAHLLAFHLSPHNSTCSFQQCHMQNSVLGCLSRQEHACDKTSISGNLGKRRK